MERGIFTILFLALFAWLVGGCATQPQQASADDHRLLPIAQADDEVGDAFSVSRLTDQSATDRPAVASALVFNPTPDIDISTELAREPREPNAFVGFDDQTTTFTYLRVDDDQQLSGGNGRFHDHYERQAITERFGVSYR